MYVIQWKYHHRTNNNNLLIMPTDGINTITYIIMSMSINMIAFAIDQFIFSITQFVAAIKKCERKKKPKEIWTQFAQLLNITHTHTHNSGITNLIAYLLFFNQTK